MNYRVGDVYRCNEQSSWFFVITKIDITNKLCRGLENNNNYQSVHFVDLASNYSKVDISEFYSDPQSYLYDMLLGKAAVDVGDESDESFIYIVNQAISFNKKGE